MPKKYSTLLFDMDGTIANTDELIVQSFLTLYSLYRKGEPTPREEIYYFSGPPIRETLKKEFPDLDLQFIVDEFHRISWDYYPKYTTIYDDCKKVLLKLKEYGYKLGIVTNKVHRTTEYVLKLLDLENIFDVVIGFDDVLVGKPNKEGIYKAMNKLGESSPKKVLYIGDNESDLVTANNAEVDCMLVTWGPRELDPNLKPTYKVNKYKQLLEALTHE